MASSPVDAVAQARQVGVKELHVTGGSSVNSAFARAGLLDRVIINVESIMVGQGIPLIKPAGFDLHLRLRDMKKLTPTVIQLSYGVLKA